MKHIILIKVLVIMVLMYGAVEVWSWSVKSPNPTSSIEVKLDYTALPENVSSRLDYHKEFLEESDKLPNTSWIL